MRYKTNRSKLTPKERLEAKPLPPFKLKLRIAIRDGAKTMTRRLAGLEEVNERPDAFSYRGENIHGHHLFEDIHAAIVGHDPQTTGKTIRCPYGRPGELRYLREPLMCGVCPIAHYQDDELPVMDNRRTVGWGWKASVLTQIHMPKRHARTFVKITEVRAERVQSISEADAIYEQTCKLIDKIITVSPSPERVTHRDMFSFVWRVINGDDAWDCNPWVWVIKFELL